MATPTTMTPSMAPTRRTDKLNAGEIAGLCIGLIVFILLFIALTIVLWCVSVQLCAQGFKFSLTSLKRSQSVPLEADVCTFLVRCNLAITNFQRK